MESSRRAPALGAVLAVAVLLLSAPSPAASVRVLRAAPSAVEPTAPLVAAVAVLAWLLSGWLLLVVLLTLLSRAPGALGRRASAAVRRAAPAAVRRAVAVSLGVTVAAGAGAVAPAAAAGPPSDGPPSAAASALDRPVVPAGPDLDWPRPPAVVSEVEPRSTGTAVVLGSPTSTGAAADTGAVVVAPGDTLWGLAERALAAQERDPVAAREVAAAWPAWWSANREVVGDDPDLIVPGTVLRPPDSATPAGATPAGSAPDPS